MTNRQKKTKRAPLPEATSVVSATFVEVTTIIILATIALLIAWDIAAFHGGGQDATISRISMLFMVANPEVALAAGALLGHLTWPSPAKPNRTWEIIFLVVGLLILVLMGAFHVLTPMTPVWPFLLGIPFGHVLFGQQETVLQRLTR